MFTIKIIDIDGNETGVSTRHYRWYSKMNIFDVEGGESVSVPPKSRAYVMNDKGITIGRYTNTADQRVLN